MPLSELWAELWAIRVFAIDFYIRGCDVAAALALDPEELENETLVERLGGEHRRRNIRRLKEYVDSERRKAAELVARWYGEEPAPEDFRIPALATFLPELTSRDEAAGAQAALALASMVELAGQVGAKVVEFVLGRTVERCARPPASGEHSCDFIYSDEAITRIDRAIRRIETHVYRLAAETHVRLAAEIEPGFSYLLNSLTRVEQYIERVEQHGIEEYVGLNLDIGHLLIMNSSSRSPFVLDAARTFEKNVFHAHCSDNVGYHFRDLVPGTVHDLAGEEETDFAPWVEICLTFARNSRFSGYVAVELEGCSRIQWIQRSLLRLGYLVRGLESEGRGSTASVSRPERERSSGAAPVPESQNVPTGTGGRSAGSVGGAGGGATAAPAVGRKSLRAKTLKTIFVLTVRKEEMEAALSLFGGYCRDRQGSWEFRRDETFYEGRFQAESREEVRVVVAQTRNTGNTISGVDATHCIMKCESLFRVKPLYAMLVGICAGSAKRHAALCDVVVPPYVFDRSVYKLKVRKREPVRLEEIRAPGTPDPRLHGMCKGLAQTEPWVSAIRAKRPAGVMRVPTVHFDPLFTDNVFVEDGGAYLEECRRVTRKGIAYEMEAGGFADACQSERVPFLVVRGISDFADRKASEGTYRPYAAATAAAFALAVAKSGILPG